MAYTTVCEAPSVAAALFFVQARFDRDGPPAWRTLAAATRRGVAIHYAAGVYRRPRPPDGEPVQVRVVSERTLRVQSGEASVREAFADVRRRADRAAARSALAIH